MKFWKYLAIGLISVVTTLGLYVAWQSVSADQLLGAFFIASAWMLISFFVLLYQVWRNHAEDKPNPFGTRFQKRLFWRTIFWGPLFVVILAAEGPPKDTPWSRSTSRK